MDLKLVAEGLQFPEGPVATADGSVILVEIRRGTLSRVTADGKRSTIASSAGGRTARPLVRTGLSMSATTDCLDLAGGRGKHA